MSRRRLGILRFWGTNCDRDIWQAGLACGWAEDQIDWLWQDDRFQPDAYECFVVPGGFSYGDYLRCGALAAKAPVMESLRDAAEKGYPILGICNGFQILCEAKLLPGVLIRNESRRFVDRWVEMKLENVGRFRVAGKKIRLPIAHGEGQYFAQDLRALEDAGQIWLRYLDNPNGSMADIAGIMNREKNVAGLMPHPERALFDWMGGTDGRSFFEIEARA